MIFDVFNSSFMINAILGGVFVSISLGILGTFVVLKNQAFISDAVSHSALTGVAIGIILGGYTTFWILLVAICAVCVMTFIDLETDFSFDAIIGFVYSLFFAFGILILNLFPTSSINIESYLFGSVLLISKIDIIFSFMLSIVVVLFVCLKYSKLVYLVFDQDAAFVRGVNIKFYNYILNILVAIAVVLGIGLLGMVLVTSLLVVGPLLGRFFGKSFSQVIFYSIGCNIVSVLIGLLASYYLNVPSGACIIIVSSILLLLSYLFDKYLR